jgi:hypothetical protein
VADDIVTRLRDRLDSVVFVPDREDVRQAADEIERLRGQLEQSRQDHLATFLELMEERCG